MKGISIESSELKINYLFTILNFNTEFLLKFFKKKVQFF